ncbi:MAG: 23S rRNA (uracil(1939)-C(5))-methyltransferase RlmD [Erysipelotrichaceae bacterium]|nr:23S rRNA (uracil(1939)-C(5))-methyltransferase RlmD [Erysipelotrichaceae bacterium]
MTNRKNQVVKGTCTDYTYNGLGLLKHEGFCLFVKDMALGDEAEVVITRMQKDYGYGKIVSLITPSPYRSEPRCPVSRICGGCQLQHLSPEGQAAFKQHRVEQLMKNVAGLKTPVEAIITMKQPYGYRNKIMMPAAVDKGGQLQMGFYRYNSHEIIETPDCCLQSPLANDIVRRIRELITACGIESQIHHIMLRDMQRTGEVMAVLVTRHREVSGLRKLAEELREAFPQVASVIQNVNGADTNVVLGDEDILLSGRDHVYDQLCGLKFKISAHSFYQVNTYQTEVLYNTAMQMADLKKDDDVLDLYCGVGTIGLSMAGKVRSVTGIEIVPQAVRDAGINAQLNSITNARFICGDAGEQCGRLMDAGEHFDCVFVDPPRKGCSTQTIELLRKLAAERLVYISCDPATLARDLKILEQDYEVVRIQPVDMFPQTYHVETVCLLSHRRRADEDRTKAAGRNDWKNLPMPDQHETFVLNRTFSDQQMDALRRGNVPQAMEDKWFWYMEGSTLRAHRSWTGYCIYQIDFREDGDHVVTVNRDPGQYGCTSIEEDRETLNRLLDWWTQTPYDHYHEWLSETCDSLKKAG